MKKYFPLLSLLLLMSVLYACKKKDSFTISGTLKNGGVVKKVYLLEADSTQLNIVDSVEVTSDGKFKVERNTPAINLYKLRVGNSFFDLIAQNGDNITFETDLVDKTNTYTITGSEESAKIKAYNAMSNVVNEPNNKLNDEYQAKLEATHKEDSLLKIYRPMFLKNIEESDKQTLAFIDKNKNSLAAFYAISSLDAHKYEAQMVAYADGINDELKKNLSVQHFLKQIDRVKPISVGHKAPDFSITTIDGKSIKLSDYEGKFVMIDFWASWCSPCREESPNLVKQYSLYKDKGLNILGVSLDEKKTDWQTAILQDKLSWVHASDLQKFDGPTERLYQIEAIPSNFIIDPQGVIIAKNLTGTDLQQFLSKTFSKP